MAPLLLLTSATARAPHYLLTTKTSQNGNRNRNGAFPPPALKLGQGESILPRTEAEGRPRPELVLLGEDNSKSPEMPWPSRKRDKGAVADKKEPDAKIAKTEEETEDKEEEEKSTKPPAGSSKSGWKNWKKAKESDSGGEESKITYCHWLLKSEPESRLEKGVDVKFSIEDLKAQPNQTTFWEGVRNYQARNFLRAMKLGQQAFFYHSNCKEPGIVGIVKIVKEAYPDHTQFDQKDPHYDSSSRKENPKWSMVDVQFVRMTKRFIPLSEIKTHHLAHKADGGPLKNMMLFSRQRLSIQPLTQEEFDFVLSLEEEKPH